MSVIGGFLQIEPQELSRLIADPESVYDFIFPDGEENENAIDVDKAWHALHFLLTGSASDGEPPLVLAILGGTEIGEDNGYGPPRYLTADEVRSVAEALESITPDDLADRYNASVLSKNKIYPEIWEKWDDNEAAGYVAAWYEPLRDYYLDAASKGNAMLKYFG